MEWFSALFRDYHKETYAIVKQAEYQRLQYLTVVRLPCYGKECSKHKDCYHVRWLRKKQRSNCFFLELLAPPFLSREKVEKIAIERKECLRQISLPPCGIEMTRKSRYSIEHSLNTVSNSEINSA